jgi:hypothetical protein
MSKPIVYPEGVTEFEVQMYLRLIKRGCTIMQALKFMMLITEPNPMRN